MRRARGAPPKPHHFGFTRLAPPRPSYSSLHPHPAPARRTRRHSPISGSPAPTTTHPHSFAANHWSTLPLFVAPSCYLASQPPRPAFPSRLTLPPLRPLSWHHHAIPGRPRPHLQSGEAFASTSKGRPAAVTTLPRPPTSGLLPDDRRAA